MAETTDEKVDNDGIAEALHKALSDDDSLSDDDRKSIAEKLAEKHGSVPTGVVKPEHEHWTSKKLW